MAAERMKTQNRMIICLESVVFYVMQFYPERNLNFGRETKQVLVRRNI